MTEENLAATSLQIEDVTNPQSVSFTPDPKEPAKEPVKPPTAREAIEKSLADIEAKDGKRIPDIPRDEKPEPKKADKETPNPVKDEPPLKDRTDEKPAKQPEDVNPAKLDAPKPPQGERDINRAPDNFLPRAKERWAEAPEEVRGEFYRALDNFEKGKQEYQEDREFRKGIREYEDLAKNAGVDFKAALKNYVEIDQMVSANPVEGIRRILGAQNIDLIQFAQHVLGQAQQAQADPKGAALTQFQQREQQLQTRLQEQAKQLEEMQRVSEIQRIENTLFAEFKVDHPRFDELRKDIALFWNSDKIPSTLSERDRLEEAYYMAERINPAPTNSRQNAQRPINPAGERSIKGALTNGLDIVPTKGAKLNSRDAINAAMEQLGL